MRGLVLLATLRALPWAGAIALSLAAAPVRAQSDEPFTIPPAYVGDMVMKGCFAALAGSLDFTGEGVAERMGLEINSTANVFFRNEQGEAPVTLHRRKIGNTRLYLEVTHFPKSRACEIFYGGPDFIAVRDLLRDLLKEAAVGSREEGRESYDDYRTDVSDTEELRITMKAGLPREGQAVRVTAEIVAKP